jgi:serine/threonine-protein kinase HipA
MSAFASILPYDIEPGVRSAMKIGEHWELAKVTDADWASVGHRLGLDRGEAVERAASIRSRIPAAIHRAAGEDRVPEDLRERARAIAVLIAAHADGKRDAWGRVTTTS